jgi:tRNA(Arg) A34 adenosine deaminase TadA
MFNDKFMARAIELSRKALIRKGLGPFGAVVVRDGEIIGEGYNQAVFRCDPTSHSEVEAIRDACSKLQTINLEGCELYTSCEPCSLCVATMLLSRIDRVYYGASTQQSMQAMPNLSRPITLHDLREQTGLPIDQRKLAAEQRCDAEAVDVLAQWASTL